MEQGSSARKNIITVVCGPPGSGKSTYVNERRAPGDLVWDFDVVMQAIAGSEIHETPDAAVRYGVAMRTAFYAEAKKPCGNRIWIIEQCPTVMERLHFKKLFDAEVVLLTTPEDVCIERVRCRGEKWPALVSKWFRKAEQWFDRAQAKSVGQWS